MKFGPFNFYFILSVYQCIILQSMHDIVTFMGRPTQRLPDDGNLHAKFGMEAVSWNDLPIDFKMSGVLIAKYPTDIPKEWAGAEVFIRSMGPDGLPDHYALVSTNDPDSHPGLINVHDRMFRKYDQLQNFGAVWYGSINISLGILDLDALLTGAVDLVARVGFPDSTCVDYVLPIFRPSQHQLVIINSIDLLIKAIMQLKDSGSVRLGGYELSKADFDVFWKAAFSEYGNYLYVNACTSLKQWVARHSFSRDPAWQAVVVFMLLGSYQFQKNVC
jgi:hypothetical protein